MILQTLSQKFTVCKIPSLSEIDLTKEIFFIAKTDEELSLVCETRFAPENTISREDGWKAFRIWGILDFSFIGILSKLTSLLAENQIGVFAVSTYNTDYILVKEENFEKALTALGEAGYEVDRGLAPDENHGF